MIRGLILALVGMMSLASNADFTAPPRYDGAGYSVLAISLLQGRGYREIDHPDAPPHAHFPPGYPLALAAVWSVTGVSFVAAHAFSFACTTLAMLMFWRWTTREYVSGVAFLMSLALAINWRWGRDGAAIQSEPLFLLLVTSAMVLASRLSERGGMARGVGLGVVLGAMVLTRHVGVAVVLAVGVDLVVRGRRREAAIVISCASIVVAPWVVWLAVVGGRTQVSLVPVRGIGEVLTGNTLFYLQRLIDTLIGPVIEVATVFRPRYSGLATALAAVACLPIVWGWIRLARDRDRRLMGLVPLCMIPLLLVWPFTEAGRFLVPMVPFVILGMVEGLAAMVRNRDVRSWTSALALALSIPYPTYAIATRRAEAARSTHAAFDAACAWIAKQEAPRGPVLTRHPGEVFLLTQRTAIAAPDGASPANVGALVDRHGAAYLLIDDDRFARAPTSPLGKYAIAFPDSVREVFVTPTQPEVRVMRVLKVR